MHPSTRILQGNFDGTLISLGGWPTTEAVVFSSVQFESQSEKNCTSMDDQLETAYEAKFSVLDMDVAKKAE
ncbi:hypothetical protein T06_9591, partial [Trichinella sp. T6]